MSEIQQNTLYLLTQGSYLSRDHLTLLAEVPVDPPDLPETQRNRDSAIETRKVSIPIHHLESACVFGASTVTAPALDLCWEHGVAVNYLSEHGHFQARLTGVADTSVTLRRAQFRAADDPARCAAIARQIVAGGAVEFTEAGRKRVIKAYQERKQEKMHHPLLDQQARVAQMPFIQARILARCLRGDLAQYIPLVPK